jgi:hypothetical protein
MTDRYFFGSRMHIGNSVLKRQRQYAVDILRAKATATLPDFTRM